MKARGRMNHTLGPTALIHFTRHKCHGQEFTLAHITNTNAQQTHNNEYRYTIPRICYHLPPAVSAEAAVRIGFLECERGFRESETN